MALKPKRHLTGVSRPSRFPTNDPVLRASEGEPTMKSRFHDAADSQRDPQRCRGSGGLSVELPVFPPVLNEAQTAALLGISARTLLKLRCEAWFPAPVQLGSRATRWLRDEVLKALAESAPRGGVQQQPVHLVEANRRAS